ncbi:MAG: NAD(P)/FAD-dependent oxidoreductase [Bradyrhizobium sp.]|uniref:flavin-containing monooxygenase n=1 Tax=Bradyrhizobium sp. TaxID=376 RepID=UPI0027276635|nr:NAD(P)/FAD-dependent oxidoreductase [Bradyrhizobium sp.]MDO8399109.1 NAD(P)/FAD-dependent oxidoreductase [Bradyrhizobium sp.]
MLEKIRTSAEAEAKSWIADFSRSLAGGDAAALRALFVPDSHWRNLCGISFDIATFSGAGKLADQLCRRARAVAAAGFEIDTGLFMPRRAVVAGQEVIEAIFRFDTANGPAVGVVRLLPSPGAPPKAWTLSTVLDIDRIGAAKSGNIEPTSHSRDFAKRNWLEERQAEIAFEGREPDVLVVGGGHAGISAAVELKRLGLDTLVIDRQQRVGDNWRLRYHGLKLHNKTPVNHLRYMPFPPNWPDYIPKDKIANWLEAYVESMEVNFWTGTVFEGAEYDQSSQSWMARIRRGDGSVRMLRPKHIVMATSVSGTPNIPTIATIENFAGKVLHSSRFAAGAQWRGKSVIVMGTGTSAHDISQELQANGADVTMVQRSPTLVVNVDPSAQLYDKTYLGDGPPVEIRDLLNASVPLEVVKASHKIITKEVRELDAPLLSRLEQAGFRLEFGEDGTGWPLKFRTRGGGYYFNVGCSELIADGKIRLIQADDIRQFVSDGLLLGDGSKLAADLVVLATGYKGQDHIVGSLFGAEVAARVGPIWGFDADSQELRNMWTRTGQPGLWFTGGSFSQCRIYSRFIALQIDAIEEGRLEKAL